MTPILIVEGYRYHVDELIDENQIAIVRVDGKKVNLEILYQTVTDPPRLFFRSGNRVLRISAEPREDRDSYSVEVGGTPLTVTLGSDSSPPVDSKTRGEEGPILVTSPMAGRIAAVRTSAGVMVEEGQALVMLEAMKMENEIAAPRGGRVKEIYVKAGALAKPGDKLVLIE